MQQKYRQVGQYPTKNMHNKGKNQQQKAAIEVEGNIYKPYI